MKGGTRLPGKGGILGGRDLLTLRNHPGRIGLSSITTFSASIPSRRCIAGVEPLCTIDRRAGVCSYRGRGPRDSALGGERCSFRSSSFRPKGGGAGRGVAIGISSLWFVLLLQRSLVYGVEACSFFLGLGIGGGRGGTSFRGFKKLGFGVRICHASVRVREEFQAFAAACTLSKCVISISFCEKKIRSRQTGAGGTHHSPAPRWHWFLRVLSQCCVFVVGFCVHPLRRGGSCVSSKHTVCAGVYGSELGSEQGR